MPIHSNNQMQSCTRDGQQELLSLQFATDKNCFLVAVGLVKEFFKVICPENYEYPTKVNTDFLTHAVLAFLRHYLDYQDDCIPDEIYLVSHFSQAEFSNIEDLDNVNLFQANKALPGKFEANVLNRKIKIFNKDLYGLLSTSLDKVGESLGINKLSLDGIGGQCESYWKANMDLLYRLHPGIFRDYANRDAVICYHTYTKLRQFFIDKYNLGVNPYLRQVVKQL